MCMLQGNYQRKLQWVMTTTSASGVFSLVDGRINTTSTSCTVSRSSWAEVYKQEAATKCNLHKGTTLMQILLLCYLHLFAASHFYTCAYDDLDTVQIALVVFFLSSAVGCTIILCNFSPRGKLLNQFIGKLYHDN